MGYNLDMKKIEWKNKAIKQLRKIPKPDRLHIETAVSALAEGFEFSDIKVLKNHMYHYRLRVARYRVLFNHCDEVVEIEEVKKRDESTY